MGNFDKKIVAAGHAMDFVDIRGTRATVSSVTQPLEAKLCKLVMPQHNPVGITRDILRILRNSPFNTVDQVRIACGILENYLKHTRLDVGSVITVTTAALMSVYKQPRALFEPKVVCSFTSGYYEPLRVTLHDVTLTFAPVDLPPIKDNVFALRRRALRAQGGKKEPPVSAGHKQPERKPRKATKEEKAAIRATLVRIAEAREAKRIVRRSHVRNTPILPQSGFKWIAQNIGRLSVVGAAACTAIAALKTAGSVKKALSDSRNAVRDAFDKTCAEIKRRWPAGRLASSVLKLIAFVAIAATAATAIRTAASRVIRFIAACVLDGHDASIEKQSAGGLLKLIILCASVGKLVSLAKYFSLWARNPIAARSLANDAFDGMMSAFSSFLNWLSCAGVKIPQFVMSALDAHYPAGGQVREWATKVMVTYTELSSGVLKPSAKMATILQGYTHEGLDLRRRFGKNKEAVRDIDRVLLVLKEANKLCPSSTMEATKQQPFSIVIRGQPGIGKTAFMGPFICRVLARTMSNDEIRAISGDFQREIYQITPNSEYSEGYIGQKVIAFDDFMQFKKPAGSASDLETFFTLMGPWQSPLNMANAESKGKVYAQPTMVVLTTNLTDFTHAASPHITSTQALERRLNMMVELQVKPEYCVDGRGPTDANALDFNKYRHVLKAGDIKSFDDVWEVKICEGSMENNTRGRLVSVSQFVDEVSTRISAASMFHDSVRNCFANFARETMEHLDRQSPQAVFVPPVQGDLLGEWLRRNSVSHYVNPSTLFRLIDVYWSYRNIVCVENITVEGVTVRVGDRLSERFFVVFGVQWPQWADAFAFVQSDLERQSGRSTSFSDMQRMGNFVLSKLREGSLVDHLQGTSLDRLSDALFAVRCAIMSGEEDIIPAAEGWVHSFGRFIDEARAGMHTRAEVVALFVDYVEAMSRADHYAHTMTYFCDWMNSGGFATRLVKKFVLFWVAFAAAAALVSLAMSIFSAIFALVKPIMLRIRGFFQSDSELERQSPPDIGRKKAIKPQSHRDPAEVNVRRVIERNKIMVYPHRVERGDVPDGIPPTAIAIGGNCILVNKHFEDDVFDVTLVHASVPMLGKDAPRVFVPRGAFNDMIRKGHRVADDLVVISVPGFSRFKDITSHFVSRGEMQQYVIGYQKVPAEKDAYLHLIDALDGSIHSERVRYVFLESKRLNERESASGLTEYKSATRAGDCGSLLTATGNNAIAGKVLSVHCYGGGGRGYGHAVYRDDLIVALKEEEAELLKGVPFVESEIVRQGNQFFELATTTKPVGTSGASKLVKTALHNTYTECSTAPARLHGEDVWQNALSSYCGDTTLLDEEVLQSCVDCVGSRLITLRGPHGSFPLRTFEESVVGSCDALEVAAIPRNTSAGWPLTQLGHQGKKTAFGIDEAYDLSGPHANAVRQSFDEVVAAANRGDRRVHFFSDFLKDETRPCEKVLAGKTRLVSGCPMVYTLCVRAFFLDFVNFIVGNRVTTPSCIGINQYKEWSSIVSHVYNVGAENTMVAGDFKNFDGSLSSQVLWAVFRVIEMWYGADPNNIGRRTLWCEVVNSRHIRGKLMYEWHKGLPSGHPMTSVINSIANTLLFHYAWVLITRLPPVRFLDDNRLFVYGDDNIVAVHNTPEAENQINQFTLAAAFRRMGLTYTSENKDDTEVSTVRPLTEISFLKRGFRREGGYWYAPLDLQTILEIPMWCMNKAELDKITAANIATALMELSAHPQDVWDQWAEKIISAAREHGFVVLTTSREENQALYRGMDSPW
jgi:hypothetical protein